MIAYIFVGGGLGASANYTLSILLTKWNVESPFIHWLINMIGCLCIGVFYALEKDMEIINLQAFTILTGGFLTGFTNYSIFSLDLVQFLMRNEYKPFILYVIGTVGTGLMVTYLGILLVRKLFIGSM